MVFENLHSKEQDWLRSTKAYPESGLPLYERWGVVLSLIPEARSRPLSDDFSDVYRRAMSEATGSKLVTAVDLSLIQLRWYMHLAKTDRARAHWCRYACETVAVWRDRLLDRMHATVPDHFEEDEDGEPGRFVPAHETGPIRHDWRH